MSAVNSNAEAIRLMNARMDELERKNTRLEQKVDNVNRNIVTASTLGGGAVGAISGVVLLAVSGWVPATWGTAKVAACYLGAGTAGGATGAGVGWAVGEVLVNVKS